MVLDIGNDYIEIDFSVDNGGIRPVTWHDICKDIDISDFVQVMSGADAGVTGWVDNVYQDNVNVVDKISSLRTQSRYCCSLNFTSRANVFYRCSLSTSITS